MCINSKMTEQIIACSSSRVFLSNIKNEPLTHAITWIHLKDRIQTENYGGEP